MFRLKKKNFLANEYYTLINSLSRLTQEEIVELYASENIPYTDLDLEIKEIEDRMNLEGDAGELEKRLEDLRRKKPSTAYRYYLTVMGRRHNIRRFPSQELRNKIVSGTMYLVIINAAIVYKLDENRLSFDDLVQYGMEALLSAAHYYVPGGEAKFETYASKCIKNKMLRMMTDSKKMKKSPCKLEDFFEEERIKIKELEMLLEAEKYSFGFGYNNDTEDHLIIHRLNRRIVHYNRDKDKRVEHNLKIRKTYGKTIDEVFDRYSKLFKNSKLNVLITDVERRDIEAYLAYMKIDGSGINYARSQCYLDLYKYKLNLIEKYILFEKKLRENGEEVTEDNIFKLMNEDIKMTNRKISELKNSGFFEECENEYMVEGKFYYEPLESFYKKYREMYGINILEEAEYDGSRAYEKKWIVADYQDLHEDYEFAIEEICQCESEKVCIYLRADQSIAKIIPYVPFEQLDAKTRDCYDGEEDYYAEIGYFKFDKFYIVDSEELLNKLRETLKETEDEYVKRILKGRSDAVNKALKKINAPIIEENMKIREMEDLYNLGKKYHRYIKDWEIKNLEQDVKLLYDDDPNLIDLLLSCDRTKKRQLTVEEEVINYLFLEDYYQALEELSDLEKEIMLMYYNNDGCSNLTLKEVADILGISLDKVKREKAKALKKLQKNEKLLSYYNEV